MHLGVNLRKAFIESISPILSHQNSAVNTFVHEFTKEFRAHGTPEYCVGNVNFQILLNYSAVTKVPIKFTSNSVWIYIWKGKWKADILLRRQMVVKICS